LTLDEGVDALRLVQSKDVSLQSAMNELQIEAAEPRSAA
jgi:hypothetical protein